LHCSEGIKHSYTVPNLCDLRATGPCWSCLMLSLLTDHPLICAMALVLIDLGLWRLLSANGSNWKLLVRLVIFSLFSVLRFNEGLNPMEPAPWADNVPLHLAATGLQIGWWLFGARTLTVLIGAGMMQRVGHTGRLLQDLLGAVIFLIAVIAALAFVLELAAVLHFALHEDGAVVEDLRRDLGGLEIPVGQFARQHHVTVEQ